MHRIPLKHQHHHPPTHLLYAPTHPRTDTLAHQHRICNHERRRLGQRTTIQLCSSRLYTRSRWPPGHPCSDISSILCCSKGQHAQSVHVVCSICACVCVVSTDLARTASTYMLTTNGICEISRTTIVVDACCLLLSWLLRSSFSIATSFPGEHAYKYTHTPYYTYTHMCVCGCVFSLPPFLLAPHVARVQCGSTTFSASCNTLDTTLNTSTSITRYRHPLQPITNRYTCVDVHPLLCAFRSYFLSWVATAKLNHCTKRMMSTRLFMARLRSHV